MSISIRGGIVDETWSFRYDGEELTLHVQTPGSPHSLRTVNRSGFANRHPWEIFFRVLNELVWFYRIEVRDIAGGHSDYSANADFQTNDDSYAIRLADFKQKVFNEDQHLALGLYREGISSGSTYYAFLCYARILEIPFKNGKCKGDWIEREIPNLKGSLATSMRDRRIHMLCGKPLAKWLQDDGRHGLSHANIQSGQVVRDPNSYQDWEDIKWGNTVMQELAEKAITDELGVETRGN